MVQTMFEAAAASFIGRRINNEDRVWFHKFAEPRGELVAIAALADGIGGQAGGEEASTLAIETLQLMETNTNHVQIISQDKSQLTRETLDILKSLEFLKVLEKVILKVQTVH